MERGMTVDQVVAGLWRRRGLVGAVAAGVFVVGTAVVATLPSVYTSTVVVRVDPQRTGPEMIQNTVGEQVEQRLLTVRQELLGRPVLQKAIEELNLYPETVSKSGIDAAIERMRKDIDVKVDGTSSFEMTYSAQDAQTAQKVAERLPQIVTEQTVKNRQAQAARATALFSDELTKLKGALSNWERSIAQFKLDHLGELPEQMELNMHALDRIGVQLNTKSEELRAAEARRSDLARSHHLADTEVGRLEASESGLTRDLITAKTHWTAEHPELKRIAEELDMVRQRRQLAESKLVAERQERARVTALIGQIEGEIADLHKTAQSLQARLERTPRWAHELSVMQNEYEAVKTKYHSVLSRKVEAEISQELELRGAKDTFQVISPAAVPTAPAKPDRMTGMLVALLAALGLSVLTGVVLEMRDDSIRSSTEIKQHLPIPVLAVVPSFGGKAERRALTPARQASSPSTALN